MEREPERSELVSLCEIGENNRIRLVAVLRAYIDDTGNHDETGQKRGSDVAGVVGYIATVHQWAKLDWKWRKELRAEGLAVGDFHAFDLQWKREAFSGWSDERRDAFVGRLANLIDKYTLCGVGGLVLVKDFDQMPNDFKNEIGNPFYIGIHNLLNLFTSGHIIPDLERRKVNFFFEQMKPAFETKLTEIFTHIRDVRASHVLGQLTTGGDKRKLIPLQAADLAAYQVRAEISRIEYKPHLDIRPAMERLRQTFRLDVAYSDLSALRRLYYELVIERARLA